MTLGSTKEGEKKKRRGKRGEEEEEGEGGGRRRSRGGGGGGRAPHSFPDSTQHSTVHAVTTIIDITDMIRSSTHLI